MSTAAAAPPGFNFAHFAGIHSLAAAIVFAVLYVPLFALYVFKSIRRPTYVFIVLSFFCALRVAAFVLRALLAGKDSAGQNLDLLIAEQIIYSVGFFGLLYSAYTLVLDRAILADPTPPSNPILRLTRNRGLFRLGLIVAVALGITGTSEENLSHNNDNVNTGTSLRKASIYIFLVLTVLLVLQTLVLVREELSTNFLENDKENGNDTANHNTTHNTTSIGGKHGIYILCLISILLLAREAFFAATAGNQKAQGNEKLFYPLSAMTEFLAVCLFSVKGLVPARSELPK